MMETMTTRELAQKAMCDIRQAGQASEYAVCTLMQAKLCEAREELELATDTISIFRAGACATGTRDPQRSQP